MEAGERKGILLIAATSLFFGLNGIGVRWYFQSGHPMSPENVIFWGLFGASIFATPFLLGSTRRRTEVMDSIRRDGKVILGVALLSSTGAFFWVQALQMTGASVVSLLAKSQVLGSVFLGAIFLKERFTAFEVAGILLAIPGIVLISTIPDEVPARAALMILASAGIYSIQSAIVKRFAPGLHGIEFTYLRGSGMSLVFFVAFLATGKLVIPDLFSFLFLGLISTLGLLIGRSMFFEAHKYLGIGKLNTGMLLEPVIVTILSVLFLAEDPGRQKMMGGALILLGLWMTTRKNLKPGPLPHWMKRILFQSSHPPGPP